MSPSRLRFNYFLRTLIFSIPKREARQKIRKCVSSFIRQWRREELLLCKCNLSSGSVSPGRRLLGILIGTRHSTSYLIEKVLFSLLRGYSQRWLVWWIAKPLGRCHRRRRNFEPEWRSLISSWRLVKRLRYALGRARRIEGPMLRLRCSWCPFHLFEILIILLL